MPHSLMQKVNSYALWAFRDTADRDYIHARMASRACLLPQFRWSSIHALEKYSKCIRILTRTPYVKTLHEINKSLELLAVRVDIQLSSQTKDFINSLEESGARFRYLEVSWSSTRSELVSLDRAVWELRRYCNAGLYVYSHNDFCSVNADIYNEISPIDNISRQNTRVDGGFLEKIIDDNSHPARDGLVWNNLYYSRLRRRSVRVRNIVMAQNAPFHLYPEIIDEVSKYCLVQGEIEKLYKGDNKKA